MKIKKILSLLMAVILALGCFAACGGSGSGASPENTFTWWLQQGEDSSYYEKYQDNPVWQYLLRDEYAEAKLALDFSAAPTGAEQDNFNQMLATGEYLDILSLGGLVTQSAADLYSEGILMDLTELVQQYMPNYMKHIETHDSLGQFAWSEVDGEQKILQLYHILDCPKENFQGYMYRRDWVAKYGANPSTGEAFTGGLADASDKYSWQDNILFPSWYGLTYTDGKLQENADTKAFMAQYAADYADYDGTYPVTLTDWEWMFEIFDKAHDDLGIDSYHISLYYPGYNQIGGLNASFGGGSPWWYNDEGTVRYGGTEESLRAYIQCMQSWYEKGWLDQDFDTRSDMFYKIDTASTYQGKVGMWTGMQSQSGPQMDTGDGYTSGIMVYGCAYPVNDIYGGAEQKYVIPNAYYAYATVGHSIGITHTAADKNLPALLTLFDFLYTEEGARLLWLGLTKEQYEEIDSELYRELMPNGTYTVTEGTSDYKYTYTPEAAINRDQLNALMLNRIYMGLELQKDVDQGRDIYTRTCVQFWDRYPTSAVITDAMKAKLTPDEQKTRSKVENNMTTYMSKTVPMFIKGQLDVTGKDWDDFCATQNKYGVQKMIDIYQAKYDQAG